MTDANSSSSSSSPSPDASGDDGDTSMAVGGLVIGLAVVFVALRFYARIISRAGLSYDDWFILAAVVVVLLTAGLQVWTNTEDPQGSAHASDPSYTYTDLDIWYTKISYITTVLYFTIVSFTKLSILLMYNRIFSVSVSFRRQVYAAVALVLAFWIGCTVADLTDCIPIEWTFINSQDDPRYCFNYNVFWVATGACEAFLDVLILALPVRQVLSLQLSPRKKATVAFIFLLGSFVLVTGMIKAILGYVPGSREPDFTRTELWTDVHSMMAIVCACLPVLMPLVHRLARSKLFAKISGLVYSRSARSRSGEGEGSGSSRDRAAGRQWIFWKSRKSARPSGPGGPPVSVESNTLVEQEARRPDDDDDKAKSVDLDKTLPKVPDRTAATNTTVSTRLGTTVSSRSVADEMEEVEPLSLRRSPAPPPSLAPIRASGFDLQVPTDSEGVVDAERPPTKKEADDRREASATMADSSPSAGMPWLRNEGGPDRYDFMSDLEAGHFLRLQYAENSEQVLPRP